MAPDNRVSGPRRLVKDVIRMRRCASILVVDDIHGSARMRYADEHFVAASGRLDQKPLTDILHVSHSVTMIFE